MKVASSKDETGKSGFWKLDLERLEESRRAKRRSSLTVRAPRNRHQNMPKPVKKTKRYRPYQSTGERKHNILSKISICGEWKSVEMSPLLARLHFKNCDFQYDYTFLRINLKPLSQYGFIFLWINFSNKFSLNSCFYICPSISSSPLRKN